MSWITTLEGALGSDGVLVVGGLTLLILLVGIHGLRRQGATRPADALATVVLLVALAGVLTITLQPSSGPAPWRRVILDPILGASDGHGHTVWRPLLANVILFVPLGAFAAARVPARLGRVWIGLVALSVAIEIAQFLLPIDRIANTADVLANATGAAVGIGISAVARLLVGRPPAETGRGRAALVTARRRP